MLTHLGDLLVDWKVQLVPSSLYLISSIVRTSGNNMDLARVVKYEIAFPLAKSNLQYLKPQFNCPEACEGSNEIGKGLSIKNGVTGYCVTPQDFSNVS